MTLSKNQVKLIKSLQQKKNRQKHKLFVAEGVKVVEELLSSSFETEYLFAIDTYTTKISPLPNFSIISESELKQISSLKTPNKILGVFKIPKEKPIIKNSLIVALDGINDPGNLGTIIRLCDWFGIEQLVCSIDTVDCYNQKVIQATMGSITRVNINYTDILDYLSSVSTPLFSADLNGENIYTTTLPKEAVLIMGNEANGVSSEVNKLIQNVLTIPRFGTIQKTESLNVATATAIMLSEFRRG